MKKYTLLFVAISTFFAACNNTPSSTKTAGDAAQKVELRCEDLGTDKMDIPHNRVVLLVNNVRTVIDSAQGCGIIDKVDYKDKQIPAEAVAACGGWFAGAGDYFYAIEKNGKIVVFKGWQAEEQEDEGFHWEEVK